MTATAARWLVLAAVLGALVALAWASGPALTATADARPIERVRGYVLGEGQDPVFRAEGGDTLVRLVTNAQVDAAVGGAEVDYAIGVRISRPGAAAEEHTLYLRTHRTGPLRGVDDPVFDAAGTPLGDSRHVDLVLDPPAAPGTEIAVRAVGGVRSLLRAWTRQPRATTERATQMLALYPELRARLVDTVGVGAWDHLTADERAALTAVRFKRLAAAGNPGRGYVAHDFYLRPGVEVDPDPPVGVATDLSRPATWLVVGPAPVTLTAALTGDVPGALALRSLDAAAVPLGAWDVQPGGAVSWRGEFGPGLHTLELAATGATAWSVALTVPPASRWPPGGPDGPTPASIARLRTSPIGPDAPAVFDARGPADPEARRLEVEVWGTGADPTVRIETRTASGRVQVEALPLVLREDPYDAWIDDAGLPHPVRGPARVKLLLPVDAERVSVSADVAALVRFRVPLRSADPTFDEPPVVRAVGFDDGEGASRSWVRPLSPATTVEVQVAARVEPVPPPIPPPPTWVAHPLAPKGVIRRFEAIERVYPPYTGRVWTEVRAGRAVAVAASSTGLATGHWRYEVDDRARLGASIPLRFDGADAGTLRLTMTRGSFRLPPLAAGSHVVQADPPPGVRLFVDVPPTGDTPTYRTRTVWPLAGEVVVPVRVAAGTPRALDLVVYHRAPGARSDVSIEVTLDGGAPRRRASGAYTRATPPRRTWALPEPTRPEPASVVDGDRGAIGAARTLVFPLGDDLEPGVHWVRVRSSTPMMARFFVLAPVSYGEVEDE